MARMTKAQKQINETKRLARHEEVRHAMEHGCPQCGAKIRRNLALTGWFQCSQFGTEGFRADNNKPSCSWQQFAD